jgi:hypothetical protein
MIWLLIYVVLVAVLASLMKWYIDRPLKGGAPSACSGNCRQGRDCTCRRESRNA